MSRRSFDIILRVSLPVDTPGEAGRYVVSDLNYGEVLDSVLTEPQPIDPTAPIDVWLRIPEGEEESEA